MEIGIIGNSRRWNRTAIGCFPAASVLCHASRVLGTLTRRVIELGRDPAIRVVARDLRPSQA